MTTTTTTRTPQGYSLLAGHVEARYHGTRAVVLVDGRFHAATDTLPEALRIARRVAADIAR